jgi:hypothetical protein
METLNTDKPPDLVANIEVMQILEEKIAARKEAKKVTKGGTTLRQRDWIEEKVLEYLRSTPCVQAAPDKMPQLVKRLRGRPKEGFGLTDAETLQVLNFMPRESVEIHLMIEELQVRMPEERQDELLELVASCLKGDSSNMQTEGGANETVGAADEDADIENGKHTNGESLM